jgi:TetR/AcrR family transcriptional regulator, transcriptional repressor for nem operon
LYQPVGKNIKRESRKPGAEMSTEARSAETRSPKGAATRDQILDAASRLIHLQGYHCTSLDDVLRESGVGKGNFYYYFESKEKLGYAIIDRLIQGFLERTLEPALADVSANPIAQIHTLLDRVLENQRQRNCVGGCPMGNLASELSDVHEGFRRRLAGIFLRWRDDLAEALTRGQASGHLRPDCDPAGMAQFVVAALEGAILLTKVTKDISVMEKCLDHLKHHLTLYATSQFDLDTGRGGAHGGGGEILRTRQLRRAGERYERPDS